jgi:uncharacterized protein YjbJ (UPF0337 family)
MKLNYFKKLVSAAGRWIAVALLFVSTLGFVWQGAFFSNSSAMAEPMSNLIAAKDAGDQVKGKVQEDTGRAKNFIRDTADKVERTASKNAERVGDADEGGFFTRRAKKDAALIHKRAEEDAARTQKAVDKTKNAVQRTVDNAKDALN